MNVFGIGLPELAVIAAIGLLVFGPKRLPELGKTLGRTLRGFQSASQEFEREFRTAIAPIEEAAMTPALSEATSSLAAAPQAEPTPGSASQSADGPEALQATVEPALVATPDATGSEAA